MSPGRRPVVLAAWTAAVVAFLLFPLAVIAVFSFNARDTMAMPLSGPSVRWYVALWQSGALIDASVNSLVIATAAATISAVLGTGLAIGLARLSPGLSGRLGALLAGPIMTPHLVIGIALLNLYSLLDVDLSLMTVVLGHVVIATPYVLLVVAARLASLDPRIEEAARDLGASPTPGHARHPAAVSRAGDRQRHAHRLHPQLRRGGDHLLHGRQREHIADHHLVHVALRDHAGDQRAVDHGDGVHRADRSPR